MYASLKDGVAFKVIEGNAITMRPSLVITQDDCDQIIEVLRKVISKISQ